jgi:hypothetical protein
MGTRWDRRRSRRGVVSLFAIAMMWVVAAVALASAPVGGEVSLFRTFEQRSVPLATPVETNPCTVSGVCW